MGCGGLAVLICKFAAELAVLFKCYYGGGYDELLGLNDDRATCKNVSVNM